MPHPKEFFLSVLGIRGQYSMNVLLSNDLILQHKNEKEPFGELFTEKNGEVVLRVGKVDSSKGVLIIV